MLWCRSPTLAVRLFCGVFPPSDPRRGRLYSLLAGFLQGKPGAYGAVPAAL